MPKPKGGQASIANFFQDGVTCSSRVASLCASLSLGLVVGARFYDEYGVISVKNVGSSSSLDAYLLTVDGDPAEKITLGWQRLCKFPIVDSNLTDPSNIAPVCERFRSEPAFDLRVLRDPSDSRLCDMLEYADYCGEVHTCEILWFVTGVLALAACIFSEKSFIVLFTAFPALCTIAATLGVWDKTLADTADGFGVDADDDEWGLSFRMLQAACATLVLATVFALIDCAHAKDEDTRYNLWNDGIEITGRVGVVLGIMCWLTFACGLGTYDWFVTDAFVSTSLASAGLNTSRRLSFGLTQWCVEQEVSGDVVEYCMWYDHDPWGEERRTGCKLFDGVDLCTEVHNAQIILMSGIVTAFIVDVYSEKMLLNAVFGLCAGILGLYVIIAMDELKEDINDRYIDGGQPLKRADGWWFVFSGVVCAGFGFVLCLLDWCDCFGLKDSCLCLHCGTADSSKA